ncbi:MAG: tetratricopeptide repeat protein, partial [Candidatus Eisenbacteria bacterium]|nr:tetratricopeptide repeat protein [Candidatus Latescibacterota bacterium]MBD3303404.1 tetratricopeptide repeat protein [Candidatus Eisenbacteria bacterium]
VRDAPPPPAETESSADDPAWTAVEAAWEEERWPEVRELCLEMLEQDPDRVEAAEKLVAVSRRLGDTLATVRHLSFLGDLRIAQEDLEGALACFLEVLELDPQDVTARRRLARFREMNVPGADRIPEECRSSIQGVIETNGATVAVRESGGVETEEWIDLTTLLQEFRDGVREKVAPNDYGGHYDLGLSHMEMGLFEEALEEFDAVLISPGLPAQTEMKTREMRGTCLRRLERHREAIHEYRAALDVPDRPEEERGAVRYQLACVLEAAGETEESRALFRDLGRGASAGGGNDGSGESPDH